MRNIVIALVIVLLSISCTEKERPVKKWTGADTLKIFFDSASDPSPKIVKDSTECLHKYNGISFERIKHPKFTSLKEQKYVERFCKTAIQEHIKYGIPASITLAQGIYESASGTSRLYKRSKNHFGVKWTKHCGYKYVVQADDNPDDRFRVYKSDWWSYRDHSKVLMKPNYKPCQKCGDDWKCWAVQLKKCGYATSKKYTKTLINIIERNKLYEYDNYAKSKRNI